MTEIVINLDGGPNDSQQADLGPGCPPAAGRPFTVRSMS